MIECGRVDNFAERDHLTFDVLGDKLEAVTCADTQRFRAEPENGGMNSVRFDRQIDLV